MISGCIAFIVFCIAAPILLTCACIHQHRSQRRSQRVQVISATTTPSTNTAVLTSSTQAASGVATPTPSTIELGQYAPPPYTYPAKLEQPLGPAVEPRQMTYVNPPQYQQITYANPPQHPYPQP